MAARFGDVCYWIALLIVVLVGGIAIYTTVQNAPVLNSLAFWAFGGGIPFAIGWFIRYIATGRTDISPAPTPTD